MWSRCRMRMAALVAVILGVPLSERLFARDGWDIAWDATNLGFSIADSSGGES